MVNRIGLTELYYPPDDKVATAQVVFVHGLFGHPEKTWSVEKKDGLLLWPETLLPEVIPDAQVFTWGYDADIDGFLSSAGQSTIHEHAGSLLSDLSDLRVTPEQQAVPLIFVVHSLGGIIVKDALSQSSATAGTRLKDIVPHTYGVIFLGTPHRGSNSASIGKIAYQITRIVSKRPNIRLVQGLEKQSEVLDRIGDSFNQTVLKHDLSIYSFREERETRKYGFFNTMVVDSDSAKIGHASEEYGIIPADHRNMTKYTSLEDIGFKRVSSQLRRWLNDITNLFGNPLTVPVDCLQSLNSAEARIRLEEVRQAHPATFDWLFDEQKVPFITWLQASDPGDHRPFWIQGKPGSGKSTLMKFAIRNPQTLQALSGPGREKWTFSSYFFHDRGSYVQKSLPAMLQELLYSILIDNIALVQYVLPIYSTLRTEQRTRRIKWNLTSLRAAIINVLVLSTCKANLCLFLDALDEHAGENEELVRLLWDMARTASENSTFVRTKICIASRPWPIFEKSFGWCPQFAIHEHTQGDIEIYTAQRIREAMYTPQSSSAEAAIVESVVRGASGVFIWVRLVLDRITQDIVDGTPFSRLQQTIAQLPLELWELYRLTVRRIKPQYYPETWVMFQAVLGALHPLSLADLTSITRLHSSVDLASIGRPSSLPSVKTDGSQSDSTSDHVVEASQSVTPERRRWLNSRSGGLLEVAAISSLQADTGHLGTASCNPGGKVGTKEHKNPSDASAIALIDRDPPEPSTPSEGSLEDVAGGERYYVQFIHQTVKDSLMKQGLNLGFDVGNDEIDTSIYQLTAYEILLKACHRSMPSVWTDALAYAKLAEVSMHGQQERLRAVSRSTRRVLEQFDDTDLALMLGLTEFKIWIGTWRRYVRQEDISYVRTLLLAIAANLQLFVELWLPGVEEDLQSPESKFGPYLLVFAAAGPIVNHSALYKVQRINMVETLISSGCDCNGQCLLPQRLSVIIENEALDNFKYRFAVGEDDIPSSLLTSLYIFHRHQEYETESVFDIAKTLIKHGASVDAHVEYYFRGGRTVLSSLLEYHVRYGSAEWVRFILSHGATKMSTESGYSLAEYAYLRRDADIIQILTDYGLYDPRDYVSDDGLYDLPQNRKDACGQGIRMVGEMLISTIGGVGADLRPKHILSVAELRG